MGTLLTNCFSIKKAYMVILHKNSLSFFQKCLVFRLYLGDNLPITNYFNWQNGIMLIYYQEIKREYHD